MRIVVAGALLAVVAFAVPALAASHTATYALAAGSSPGTTVNCSMCVAMTSVGGATFASDGFTPRSVIVTDASGGPVSFIVCQDWYMTLCGEMGIDPAVSVCGTYADLSTSPIPFASGVPTSVFVRTASSDCVGSVATTGSITLTTG